MKAQQLFIFASNVVAISASQSLRGLNTRIIGGDEATVGQYSYIVSLADDVGHFCGGSLIAPDVVLSAAHCQGGEYKAVIGRHALDSDEGEEIPVKSEVPHPNYNPVLTGNDFMLVFLETPVVNQDVSFVKLNSDTSSPEIDEAVTVMGWGDIDAADEIFTETNVLMEVEVNVISNEECERSEGAVGSFPASYHDEITDNMLCARDSGEDACQGDSGGPLVLKGRSNSEHVQVGVVSWGIGCANADFPGVYSRVSSAYDWIRGQVCKRSLYPPSEFDCDNIEHSPTQAPTEGPPTTPWPTWAPTISPAV